MTAQIKVKVQRKAIVKLKVLPRIPASLVASPGLVITKTGATYTFSLDPTFGGVGYFTGLGIGAAWSGVPTHPLEITTAAAAAQIVQTNSGSSWAIGPTTGVSSQGWGLFSTTAAAFRISINNSGVISFPAYGTGILKTTAGVISADAGVTDLAATTANRLFGTNGSGVSGLVTLPAAGLTLSAGALALANDLSALEALSSTGFAVRTATDTWAQRSLTAPAAGLTISNNDGVSGNPTFAFANDLSALEGLSSTGLAVRTTTDAWAQRTITGTANEITVTNGDGVSGNPTLSLPAALTFTGKTVTGGAIENVTVGASTRTTGAFSALGVGAAAPVSTTQPVQITTSTAAAQIGQTNSGSSWSIGPTTGVSAAGWGLFSTTAAVFRLAINDTGVVTLGQAGTLGTLAFPNATSGTITLTPPTGALGSAVLTLPIATDTLVGKATTDTLTNKTLTSPTMTTPALGVATATSLAINGATIGSNALAVTGTVAISSTLTSTAHTITSAASGALTAGPNGATNPSLQVDASTASAATGLKIKSAAAAGGLALSVITSGTNENLTLDAAGSGTITISGTSTGAITLTRATTMSAALTYGGVTLSNAVTGTGNMVLSASPTLTGTLTAAVGSFSSTLASTAHTITSASAAALTVGLNGATNPAFTVDASTGSQAAGFKITGAATGGTVALVATDSGSNTNVTINAKGSGTIGIGSVSTGAVTITPATTLSAALTYGGVTLTNNVTGTGKMVLDTNAIHVTPNLGTPSAIVLTNATGFPTGVGFRAHRNGTDQTGIADATATTAQFNVEVFDQGNYFNTGTYTWTPPAGTVIIAAKATLSGLVTLSSYGIIYIVKNGTNIANSAIQEPVANNAIDLTATVVDTANGTDAYTVQVYLDVTSGTGTLVGTAVSSYFSGAVIH